MKPGRELDALVAEKAMGWKLQCYESGVYATEPGQYDDASKNDGWLWEGDEVSREAYEFNPSTDISAAWEVVEKLNFLSFTVSRENCCGVRCDVVCYNDVDMKDKVIVAGEALTAPHAICLAALKAVGVKIEKT